MAIRTILILLITVFTSSLFAQIPNNGFENWSNPHGYNTPDDWGNLNAKTAGASIYTCLKGTPGNPGISYLKLISRAVTGMGVQPGIAVSGILNTTTFQPVSGFAYADRPISLKGNWQFMANGSDQGYIAVYLTKWNDVLNLRDTIGKKKYLLPGMVMSWQGFSIPITYMNSDIPDSAVILLSASGTVPVNGSYLYIDNLSFYGGTVGLNDPSLTSGLLIYPNPATDQISIDFWKETLTTLAIYNISGQRMMEIGASGSSRITVGIAKLPAGIYFIKSVDPEKKLSARFLISR
jgi:hypothetical protein